MAQADAQALIERAKEVLHKNDMGGWTRPTQVYMYINGSGIAFLSR
ncbi:MAG TPA: hypothetical protein VMB52_04255 [Verrucomicrobiae bacterium]|nr:hypothetical protein [Verrucomicrobiae bacterium]